MSQSDDFQEAKVSSLPDFTRCRVEPAFGDYFDCVSGPLTTCPYALNFADGHLCRHPQVGEIFARTKDAKAASRAP